MKNIIKTQLEWRDRMRFTGSSYSKYEIRLDAREINGGNGQGASPMELFLNGIAGCTAMDVISILQKMKQEVSSFNTFVSAERASEHPKVFTRLHIEYHFTGQDLDREMVEKAVDLSQEKYCPAIAMFKKVCPVDFSIKIC